MEKGLSGNNMKNLRSLSSIVYVFAKIAEIFLYIAIPFIVIAMVVVPIIMSQVNIEENQISVSIGDKELSVKEENNRLYVYYDNNKKDVSDDYQDIVMFRKYTKNTSSSKITIGCLISLAFILVKIVFAAIILKQVSTLFKNINKQDTPFTQDNVKLIRKIAMFSLLSFFIVLVVSMPISFFVPFDIDVNIIHLFMIAIIFILSYIFEYGCKLQSNSNLTIYE